MIFTFKGDREYGIVHPTRKGLIGIRADEIIYEFALKFNKKGSEFQIAKDKLTQNYNYMKLKETKKKMREIGKLGKVKITVSNTDGNLRYRVYKNPKDLPIKREDIVPEIFRKQRLPGKTLLVESPTFSLLRFGNFFNDFSIFDFDPKLPKKATAITGKVELEPNGENLSIVLKHILDNSKQKKLLFNLVKDLLPFINNLDVDNFADKSMMFKLQEQYFDNQYLPASLISDGTINLTALIVALYFVRKSSIIIEEPERNIHPHLISRVVEMIKDASRNKQIIVTTHNPEMVKYSGIDDILLVSRDKEGFSTVSKPADNLQIKTFLENEIGIEDLHIQNLLGV
ncbi:MAG: ATP-binding protein [bacterium]|nr:ATP-binding protein [bacterium]